jgi:hypothetical protein
MIERRLSNLQRAILVKAMLKRAEHPDKPNLYRCEILVHCFGWDSHVKNEELRGRPGHLNFSRKAVGSKRYASAHASLTRTLDRLILQRQVVRS